MKLGDEDGPSSLTPATSFLPSHAILAGITIPPIPWTMTIIPSSAGTGRAASMITWFDID